MASQGNVTLPRQLALDGKFVKEVMGVVSVVNAETGTPVAVAACTRKEGEKGWCEMPVGRKLLGRKDLANALVSSDALHCQQDTVWEILCSGGEHLMQVKDNQSGVVRRAKAVVRARKCACDTKRDTAGAKSGGR